jgi:peptide chain release factor 2
MSTTEKGPNLDDLAQKAGRLSERTTLMGDYLDPARIEAELAELEAQMEAPAFWDDPGAAAKVNTRYSAEQRRLNDYREVSGEVDDLVELIGMGREEERAGSLEDGFLVEMITGLDRAEARIEQLEEARLFTGERDDGNAIVSINSGEGGTDAQDWAEMLLRMYLRWAERRGFKAEVNDRLDGTEAGIKSATFTVSGPNAYGLAAAERGVHRLVRLSPFDSAHRRQTSFAAVEVSPLVGDDVAIEIDDKDLKIDTYRASGAGGQHVNKTESAVRITHLPTKIVVQCQNERSQMQNRATAMSMLKSKMVLMELERREEEAAKARGESMTIGFGSQIRSYVIHPYSLVKDLRTSHETGNVQAVLDGDLDAFIRAELERRAKLARG